MALPLASLGRIAASLAVLAALASAGGARAQAPVRKIRVAAASDLRFAAEDMAGVFERRNPGTKVEITIGASGTLAAQVRQGAPFDLFLGDDRSQAARLQEDGLAAAPPFVYAVGRLAVWVAAPTRVDPGRSGLRAVLDPAIKKVGIADPVVAPFGAAAEKALQAAGILDAVRPKLVLGESDLQVLQLAQEASVQAVFVPWSLASVPPLASLGRYVLVPTTILPPAEQWGVVLKGARDAELAESFAAFVRGGTGRTILDRHKFSLPAG